MNKLQKVGMISGTICDGLSVMTLGIVATLNNDSKQLPDFSLVFGWTSIGIYGGALLGYGWGTIVAKISDKCFPTNISLINSEENITNYGSAIQGTMPPLVDVVVINENSNNPLVNKSSANVQLIN